MPRAVAQTAGTPVVQNDFTATGSINTQNLVGTPGTATPLSAVLVGPMNNAGDMSIQVTGTYTGALTVQGSLDGVNWVTDPSILSVATGGLSATIPSATPGIYQVGVEGFRWVQVTALSAVTGTAVTTVRVASTDSTVAIDEPLPTGSALIGGVNVAQVGGTNVPSAGVGGQLPVGGTSSNGGAATGNPVLVAGATVINVPAASIANAKAVSLPITSDSQVIVHLHGDPANEWQSTSGVTPLATNNSTTAKAAGTAGIRTYVTDTHVVNTSATVSTTFSILDGATVIWTTFLPATTAALTEIPITVHFEVPLKGTAATTLNVQCGTTGASVYWNVSGFQNN